MLSNRLPPTLSQQGSQFRGWRAGPQPPASILGVVGRTQLPPREPPPECSPSGESARSWSAGSSPEGGCWFGTGAKGTFTRALAGRNAGGGPARTAAGAGPAHMCGRPAHAHCAQRMSRRGAGAIGHLGPPRTERGAPPPAPGAGAACRPPRLPARLPRRWLPSPPPPPPPPPGCSERPSSPLAFVLILLRDKMATPAAVNPPGE